MLQKIKKETAVDKVSQQLRALIESGEFKPGDKIPSERALCEIMSISRMAVREAISGLAAKNLLEVRTGDGTYVKSITANDIVDPLAVKLMGTYTLRDLLEFRRIIEISGVALATERATEKDLKLMHDVLIDMKKGLEENNDYLEPDLAFHNLIAEASGNKILQLVLYQVGDLIRKTIRETSEDPGAPQRAYQLHYNIYERICAKDVEGAKEYMEKHLQRVEKDLLRYYKLHNKNII